MCGIVGVFDGKGHEPFEAALIRHMSDAIVHRGPDGGGMHMAAGLGLGHRRLAIIDVSGGVQPMFTSDGTVGVVFNGEIYNFADIAAELKSLGYTFRTRSDTEVILHAWDEWGEASIKKFSGMFAFALWDNRSEMLVIARDRIGKKPLYYSIPDGRRLAFASELKALATVPWVPRKVSSEAIEDYLSYGYIPDPRTIYRDIHKLPPGHMLVWRRGAAPIVSCYWDIDLSRQTVRSMPEAADELRQRLNDAVKTRLVSDVPLGAFLSGGVDSSGVVAHMAKISTQPVKTCTIGFGEASHDERDYARTLANKYHTDHVEKVLPPEMLSPGSGLLDLIGDIYDEPFADISAVPTYRVCAVARERVTVALSGDGGDEAFAGYRRYRWHTREHTVRSLLPAALRGPLFGTLGRIYPKLDWAPRFLRAKATFSELAQDAVGAYFNNVAMVNDNLRNRIYRRDFKTSLQGYHGAHVLCDLIAAAPTDQPLLQAQYADLKTWLAGRMLVKVDRASMANSLEVRNPFLDHDLMQWAFSLPAHLKLAGTMHKAVLKKSLEGDVPHELLYRAKQGFGVPLTAWLRGPLLPTIQRAMAAPVLLDAGYFEPAQLQELVTEHASGRRDHTQALWGLLMLERFLAKESGARRAAETDAAVTIRAAS